MKLMMRLMFTPISGGALVERNGPHRGSGFSVLHNEPQSSQQQRSHDEHHDVRAVHGQTAQTEIFFHEKFWKWFRLGAENGFVLAGEFDEQRDANGRDEHGELGTVAQRTIGEEFDQHANDRTDEGCRDQHRDGTTVGLRRKEFGSNWREKIRGERPEHQHVTVRKIDETQDSINHRVAERDERVDGSKREAVDQLLKEPIQES